MELPTWIPSRRDLDALKGVGAASGVVSFAPFSHGPWWGFNGVQLVVLTGSELHVVQSGYALTAGRTRLSTRLAAIQGVEWLQRRRFGRQTVQMVLTVEGRRRRYVSKYQQAADLRDALVQALPSSGER